MSALATMPPEIRRQFTRLHISTVPEQATRQECGGVTHARSVAQALRAAVQGTTYRAESRVPYWPHPENETHGQVVTLIDRRWLITYTHRVPAHTVRDLFTLTVNGRAVAYHVRPGELPHQPDTVARAVYRHIHGITGDPCHALMCPSAPTVAIYGAALCPQHAQRYAETGTW